MIDDTASERSHDWLTKVETAEYLRVSQKTIQRLLATGRLPHHRIGRSVRFRRADIDAFVEQSRSQTAVHAPEHRDRAVSQDELSLAELGRQAQQAGIRQIFKSRVEDAAYRAVVSAALQAVPAGGRVRIMSNTARSFIGPQADTTLSIPLLAALGRGVRLQLLMLSPLSLAARTRAGVEEGVAFTDDDDRFYESYLYLEMLRTASTLAEPDPEWLRDEDMRRRLRDREHVQVRYSSADPTTHLVLTDDICCVESYHTGGDPDIREGLMRLGIPDLHCFSGFAPVLSLDTAALSGRLLASHFEHSWGLAADGLTLDDVLIHAMANGVPGTGSTEPQAAATRLRRAV